MSLTEAVGPVGRTPFDHTGADTTEAVAADAQGRATRILGLALSNCHASTACLVTVQDNTGTPNVLIGPINLPGGATVVLPVNGLGWGDTAAGKKINIVQSAAVRVAGCLTYQRIGSRGPA